MDGCTQQLNDSVQKQTQDMFNDALRSIGAATEEYAVQKINEKLAQAAEGDALFGKARVLGVTSDSVTLLIRGKDTIKAIKSTVFYRAIVTIGRTLKLVDSA